VEINRTYLSVEDSPGVRDIQVAVRVCSNGFNGASESIWLSGGTYAAFVQQLIDLEARRQGSAELESETPGEFRLVIHSTDRLGHMVVEGQLARRSYESSTGPLLHAVEWGFEFCPSRLPEIVQEIRALGQLI